MTLEDWIKIKYVRHAMTVTYDYSISKTDDHCLDIFHSFFKTNDMFKTCASISFLSRLSAEEASKVVDYILEKNFSDENVNSIWSYYALYLACSTDEQRIALCLMYPKINDAQNDIDGLNRCREHLKKMKSN